MQRGPIERLRANAWLSLMLVDLVTDAASEGADCQYTNSSWPAAQVVEACQIAIENRVAFAR